MSNLLLFYVFQAFIHLFLCIFLTFKCFEKHLRFKRSTSIVIAAVVIVISIVIIELFIERTAPFLEYRTIATIGWSVIMLSFSICTIRSNIFTLLFLIFFFINCALKTRYIATTIYSLEIFPLGEVYYIVISLVVWALMSPFMFYLIAHLFKKVVTLNFGGFSYDILFILPLTYTVIFFSLGNEIFIEKGWMGLLLLLFANCAPYLSYVAVLFMFINMHDSLSANSKILLAEQTLAFQKEQYAKMCENIEATARTKHDIRQSLIVINDFLSKDNLPGLKDFFQHYETDAFISKTIPICDNYLVDVICRTYISKAEAAGINVEVSVDVSKDFTLPNNELVPLFGNLLENALEGCLKQTGGPRFISIRTKTMSNSTLAIQVSNSCLGEIKKLEQRFLSSKHTGLGLGTHTIKYIAEKTGGSAEFSCEGKVFTAKILLVF